MNCPLTFCGNISRTLFFSVLAAILLAGDKKREILLIINNYTGDRLNFGLALETARMVHNYHNVKLLLVDDDCAIDNPRQSTGRRGLAGCALVHKIAGAMASLGSTLHDIHSLCSDLLAKRLIRTIGFSFEHDKSNQLTQIEIGYGIHGEPGCLKVESEKNFKPINSILADKLRLWDIDVGCVLLFNNLGGTSEFIFYEFVREFLELAKELSLKIEKIYAGKFLTSLSKQALSVTVLEIHDPKLLDYLSLPVKTPAGHLFNDSFELFKPSVKEFQLPQAVRSFSENVLVTAREMDIAKAMIEGASKAVLASKLSLNEIDGELGDGDTGSTLVRGAEALLLELSRQKIALQDPFVMLSQISSVLMERMGGTSGAIFSIFFQCASGAFSVSSDNRHSVGNWMRAVTLGMEGIQEHGRASLGDRTLLDALDFGFRAALGETGDAGQVMAAFARGCREGAEATITMIPKSGRSAYTVGDDTTKYDLRSKNPDAGAQAINLISTVLAKAFESSSKGAS